MKNLIKIKILKIFLAISGSTEIFLLQPTTKKKPKFFCYFFPNKIKKFDKFFFFFFKGNLCNVLNLKTNIWNSMFPGWPGQEFFSISLNKFSEDKRFDTLSLPQKLWNNNFKDRKKIVFFILEV